MASTASSGGGERGSSLTRHQQQQLQQHGPHTNSSSTNINVNPGSPMSSWRRRESSTPVNGAMSVDPVLLPHQPPPLSPPSSPQDSARHVSNVAVPPAIAALGAVTAGALFSPPGPQPQQRQLAITDDDAGVYDVVLSSVTLTLGSATDPVAAAHAAQAAGVAPSSPHGSSIPASSAALPHQLL
jgi:hypothetical protein